MKFDIGIWWHWLFIALATLGSAWNACRVFISGFETSRNPFHIPILKFVFELAGSMAGWMSFWYLLPLVLECTGSECGLKFSWQGLLLLPLSILGILGKIPAIADHLIEGMSRWLQSTS